jgi:hypothetical protein
LAYNICLSIIALIECEIDGTGTTAVFLPHAYEVCLSSNGFMRFVLFGVKGLNVNDSLIIIVVSAGVILWAIFKIHSRQQLRRARERGLWPTLGQIPTDAAVARLAKAGEKILAIRMSRQIHNLDLAEAKAVVNKLTEPSSGANLAPR